MKWVCINIEIKQAIICILNVFFTYLPKNVILVNISDNEIPQIHTFQNGSELILRVEVKNCTIIRGPMSYAIEILCKVEWCQEKDNLLVNITDNLNPVINHTVLGHTNYTIGVGIYRNSSSKPYQKSILTETTGKILKIFGSLAEIFYTIYSSTLLPFDTINNSKILLLLFIRRRNTANLHHK